MKIGILGTGHITDIVTPTLIKMEEIECYAVASRSSEKAEAFRKRYSFQKAYGSYQNLLNDPQVELVYVASPHSHHYEYMMQCLEHSKPFICEKAFTVNAEQAREIKAFSEGHGVFATEAIWTRYMPSRSIIQQVLDSGVIGEVRALSANLCYAVGHRERLRNPALAGGALLDVGVYGINFALMHFGTEIERIESSVQMTDTGVDGMETVTIFFKNGRMAVLTAGILFRSDRQGIFYGTKGYIVVKNINNPQSVTVYNDKDEILENISVPPQISGYEYEFRECVRALQAGRTETWSMPLSESVRVMEIMDSIRNQWGFAYPQERLED